MPPIGFLDGVAPVAQRGRNVITSPTELMALTTASPTPSLKVRIYRMLNPGDDDSKVVDTLIILLITCNVIAVMLETEPWTVVTVQDKALGLNFGLPFTPDYHSAFFYFEWFSTAIFSVEYILRIWSAPVDPRFARSFGRLRYAFTPMAMVDIVAILPTFLPHLIEVVDTRIARAIRMFRLVRILKIGRYAYAVRTLTDVFGRKKEELAIATFVLIMLLIICSSVIYFVEHDAQPDAFPSIAQSMWWAVTTLTSVGYGDVYPITGLGKVIGGIVQLMGVVFIALPTGIISAGFLEQMREQKRGKDSDVFGFCPHCGEQLIPGEELE